MRVKFTVREKSAYIKLRRYGYTIPTLSRAFGRSTSVIHRILKIAEKRGILSRMDLRKIPNRVRRISKSVQWGRLIRLLRRWESWILGEGDKPP